MSSVSASFLHLKQLDATNWYEWKTHVSSLMTLLGLLGYMDSSTLCPGIPKSRSPNDPVVAEAQRSQREWDAKDQEAQALLLISILGSELNHTKGVKTAAEIWSQLCTIKEPKSTCAVLTACKRLFCMMMEDSTRMEEHISAFRHAQDQLANMGHALSDEDFLLLLITSLPETWDQFTSRLFGSIVSVSLSLNINSSELISILMEEDRCHREWTDAAKVANLSVGGP